MMLLPVTGTKPTLTLVAAAVGHRGPAAGITAEVFSILVACGPTGSGKMRIIRQLLLNYQLAANKPIPLPQTAERSAHMRI